MEVKIERLLSYVTFRIITNAGGTITPFIGTKIMRLNVDLSELWQSVKQISKIKIDIDGKIDGIKSDQYHCRA